MATTISAQSSTDRTFDPSSSSGQVKLSNRQKHLATIAALEAQGDLVRLEPAITEALKGGVTINEIKEAFSQLYAYTGFPRSLNALGVLSKVLNENKRVWSVGKPWQRPTLWDDAKKAQSIDMELPRIQGSSTLQAMSTLQIQSQTSGLNQSMTNSIMKQTSRNSQNRKSLGNQRLPRLL